MYDTAMNDPRKQQVSSTPTDSTAESASDGQNSNSPELAAEQSFYKDETLPREERARLWLKNIVDALIRKELPLQSETSYFILVNMLDFFVTYLLLAFGAMEANPIADYFLKHWGHIGMLFFKLASVAFICLLAQLIATRSVRHARFVLIVGTLIVGGVVIYSLFLLSGLIS